MQSSIAPLAAASLALLLGCSACANGYSPSLAQAPLSFGDAVFEETGEGDLVVTREDEAQGGGQFQTATLVGDFTQGVSGYDVVGGNALLPTRRPVRQTALFGPLGGLVSASVNPGGAPALAVDVANGLVQVDGGLTDGGGALAPVLGVDVGQGLVTAAAGATAPNGRPAAAAQVGALNGVADAGAAVSLAQNTPSAAANVGVLNGVANANIGVGAVNGGPAVTAEVGALNGLATANAGAAINSAGAAANAGASAVQNLVGASTAAAASTTGAAVGAVAATPGTIVSTVATAAPPDVSVTRTLTTQGPLLGAPSTVGAALNTASSLSGGAVTSVLDALRRRP